MGLPHDYHRSHLEGTMEGWFQQSKLGSAAKGAHWVTFLLLAACTLFLFRDSWKAKGPRGREKFYAGYHEEYNISLVVNLFAMIAYFGKIVADSLDHNYTNVGPLVIGLGNYRYADYMLTCPLLAYDLLSQVRGPYKFLGAVLIFSVLLTGTASNFYVGDEMRAGSLAWFSFGCGLYAGSYWLFVTVVRAQYERLRALARGTNAKKALIPLRLAIYTFFTIWIVFPVVWLLGEQGFGLVSDEAQEVLHCVCDIVAKSFYGFALARYRSYFDKKLFAVLEELGLDGEEELEHLEQDLKEISNVTSSIGYMRGREDSITSSAEFVPVTLAVHKTRHQQEIAMMSPLSKLPVQRPDSPLASPHPPRRPASPFFTRRLDRHPSETHLPDRDPNGTDLQLEKLRAMADHVNKQLRDLEHAHVSAPREAALESDSDESVDDAITSRNSQHLDAHHSDRNRR